MNVPAALLAAVPLAAWAVGEAVLTRIAGPARAAPPAAVPLVRLPTGPDLDDRPEVFRHPEFPMPVIVPETDRFPMPIDRAEDFHDPMPILDPLRSPPLTPRRPTGPR